MGCAGRSQAQGRKLFSALNVQFGFRRQQDDHVDLQTGFDGHIVVLGNSSNKVDVVGAIVIGHDTGKVLTFGNYPFNNITGSGVRGFFGSRRLFGGSRAFQSRIGKVAVK